MKEYYLSIFSWELRYLSAQFAPFAALTGYGEAIEEVRAKDARRVDLPITHTAREACGKPLFANIVALGAVVELTKCVTPEALERAVLDRVPKGTEDANKKALAAGYELAKKAGGK